MKKVKLHRKANTLDKCKVDKVDIFIFLHFYIHVKANYKDHVDEQFLQEKAIGVGVPLVVNNNLDWLLFKQGKVFGVFQSLNQKAFV